MENNVTPPAKEATAPLLRWAGSKRKVLDRLRPFWCQKFSTYIEPFAGSATLYFDLQPARAVLGDINPHLINTLKSVRDHPERVYDYLAGWKRSKRLYYRLRRQILDELDELQQAARFIYLNRFCFNGIYRTNLRGEFNVPYAKADTGRLPTLDILKRCSFVLRRSIILQQDFEALVRENARENDFVYMDPPYATGARRIFREYGAKSFSVGDLPRLTSLLKELDNRGCHFVLSYASCTEALEAFEKWTVKRYYVQRNVAGFSESRRTALEILVSNLNP